MQLITENAEERKIQILFHRLDWDNQFDLKQSAKKLSNNNSNELLRIVICYDFISEGKGTNIKSLCRFPVPLLLEV